MLKQQQNLAFYTPLTPIAALSSSFGSMGHSVLDDLGAEVTGIAAPVSICMALTVALVKTINPNGSSNSGAVFLASAYYQEQAGDSAGQKLSGSIINAIIFVSIIAGMTFILVLLFKYRVSLPVLVMTCISCPKNVCRHEI